MRTEVNSTDGSTQNQIRDAARYLNLITAGVGKRLLLTSTSDSIVAICTSAITTSNLEYTSNYVDIAPTTTAATNGHNQGADLTNVERTIVAAPGAASTTRSIDSITIYNADTVSAEVALSIKVSGTNYRIAKFTLAAKATWSFPESLYSTSTGGSGTVTQVSPGAGTDFTAFTTSGAIDLGITTNAQTGTTYTILTGDRAKLVTHSNASSIAVTLPQSGSAGFAAKWFYWTQNIGAGTVTITPTTSTINGAATLTLLTGQGAFIIGDGTNYTAIVSKPNEITVNAQTGTTYTVLYTDRSKLVTHSNAGSIAVTLPQATGSFGSGWFYYAENKGAGTVTITPTTSTINGAASLALTTDQGCLIVSDGTNYQVMLGKGSSSSGLTDYIDPLALQNVGLSVTVGSSAITIALKQQDGSTDPSTGTAKCNIAFASATATSGATTMRSVTSALSMTVSNGSSLGFASTSATQRVWVGAIDNSGTVELCCWTSLSGVNLRRYNDGEIVTTTAEGGAGGADTAQTIYSTTGRTSKALRVLGYFEIQAAGSYAWTNSPTVVRVMQPGLPRTGDEIQSVISVDGTNASGTTTLPQDNTTPQSSEGNQYMSLAITPRSSLNVLRIEHRGNYSSSAPQHMTCALFQDSTADALKSMAFSNPQGNYMFQLFSYHEMLAGTTSSTTFKIRAGGSGAGTTYFNSNSGALYNGTFDSSIRIREIFQ